MDRKRGKPDGAPNANGVGSKRPRESDSSQSATKSRPCTKFFSTSGCPFGEGCHFMHYVPGGIGTVSQMTNFGNPGIPPPRKPAAADGFAPLVKTKMCNKVNTPEGCKFGDKCHFAHNQRELGGSVGPGHGSQPYGAPMGGGRFGGRFEPPSSAAASFGQSATAKISVDASLAGAIIGRGGVNSKQICQVTGAKLSIKDHETDNKLKNIELEGTFDQIKQASAMVRELIVNVSANPPPPGARNNGTGGPPAGNFKTKICEKFAKGMCTFGDRCHFAHGASELRPS